MLFSLFSGAGLSNLACSFLTSAILPACYTPQGPIPEARQPREDPLWTNEQVDAVVHVDYVTIPGGEPVSHRASPEACDNVSFLRFRHQDGPDNAEDLDAAFLMVPGVLEGANGFEFMGRQMVYKAAEHDNRHIEVWAMDRRSNCLEDLTGTHAAAAADTAEEAANLLVGYYYEGLEIDGRQFDGFLGSAQLPFLAEFGLRQTTLDMQAIIDHMMPTPGISEEKLFVGGHSLGGLHTSVYLGWNFDDDPDSETGAGHNRVAGAFALDSHITTLDSGLFSDMAQQTQTEAMDGDTLDRLSDPDDASDWGHQFNIWLLEWGLIPRSLAIPGLFTPEIIALPEHLGIMAAKAPDQEATLYDRVDSPTIDNIVNIIHSRSPATIGARPRIEHFRYTNEAYVGLMFDHNFQILGILKTGLGFMDGGAMQRKWTSLNALSAPDSDGLFGGLLGNGRHYIARDAGPDRNNYGQGPLYQWVSRDELGTADDPEFRDTTGDHVFTSMEQEPVNMQDFVRALYTGPTNLTEWYFPTRIMLDLTVVDKPFAPKHGLMTYHPDGPAKVPSIIFTAGDGAAPPGGVDESPLPLQIEVIAPGYTHMDPMFEAVNSPTQHSYVMRPLLEFAYTVLDAQ